MPAIQAQFTHPELDIAIMTRRVRRLHRERLEKMTELVRKAGFVL
jgi:hypothetical protein